MLTVFHDINAGETYFDRGGIAYQIEMRHQASEESLLIGAALEVGPDRPRHYLGAAAFVGSMRRRGPWSLEGNVGLGVEVLEGRAVKTVTVTNSATQLAPTSETTVTLEPTPGLHARIGVVGGLRIARDLDLVAQLGAHLSSSGQAGSYLSSTGGVRLRLP